MVYSKMCQIYVEFVTCYTIVRVAETLIKPSFNAPPAAPNS